MTWQIFFNFYISTMIPTKYPIIRGGWGCQQGGKGRQIKVYFAIVENCPCSFLLPVVGSCANDSRKWLKTRLKWLYRVHLAGRADMCGESSEQGTKNAPSEGWGVHRVGVVSAYSSPWGSGREIGIERKSSAY